MEDISDQNEEHVPQVVRPQVDRMEDLAWNPARLAEFARQERLGISEGHPGASPAPLHQHTPHAPQLATAQRRRGQAEQEREKRARQPQTQTPLPQMSTAQRRRNQADQPREGNGKYAEKPPSKWHAFLSHEPAPKTNLKKAPWPHPTGGSGGRARTATRAKSVAKKKTRALPSVQRMMDRPLHQKVGYVVRRWFRRKKRLFRALFSWKG